MKKYLMMSAAALVLLMTSCSKEKDFYDPQAAAQRLTVTYQNSFVQEVGTPNENQTWGFASSAAASRQTRSMITSIGDPFTNYENTDALYKSEAPTTAMTYNDYMNQDKWRRADWGGALDQNAAMNGDAEILLPDGEHSITFYNGSHDFYVTGNATLNNPNLNQARIYVLPGKTLTLNMGNYINALQIYVADNATLNYNYGSLYYQTGDACIFNRGTLNLVQQNFEINQKAVVYNEGTINGTNITSKPGDGNPSFLYNFGDINLTGKFQLNSCANFYNEGNFTAAGETELTQGNSLIWWVNKGFYTTSDFKSAAWNATCYNFCSLFITGVAYLTNGQMHMMNGSYLEASNGLFDNFQFTMANNSGVNVKNGTIWGRDGADFRGKYASPYQGFIADSDEAAAWVRLGGESRIFDHKGSAFHLVGANLTFGYETVKFFSGNYYWNGNDWQATYNNFYGESTEASLKAVQSENSTWDLHNVTKIYTGSDFSQVTATVTEGKCGATWTPGGDTNPIVEQGRIFCEDLGTIGDFDFNDVVFDAKIHKDGTTEITLLAAGGTLHLTVAGEEVHQLFGVEQKDMINTGLNTREAVTFTAEDKYEHLVDIPIIVRKQEGSNITSYQLTAEKGKAPQKICVPIGTKWCDEYVSITKAYPKFIDWVEGEDPFDWSWVGTVVEKYVDLNLQNND